jgi:hypothetical protein
MREREGETNKIRTHRYKVNFESEEVKEPNPGELKEVKSLCFN